MPKPSSTSPGAKRQKDINEYMILDHSRKCNINHEITKEEFEWLILTCPKCQAKQLIYYCTYKRWALTLEIDGVGIITLKSNRLTITRGKCCSCKATHAILPGDIVPYKQYSLKAIISILLFVLEGKLSVENVANMTGISSQVIYGIIRQWSFMLARLALLLRDIYQIHTITGKPCDNEFIIRFIATDSNRAPPAYLRYFKWPMFMAHNQKAITNKISIGISEQSKTLIP